MAESDKDEEDQPSVLAEAEAVKASTRPPAANRTRQIVTGAAIGIGSAALVAALLYANRARKGRERKD